MRDIPVVKEVDSDMGEDISIYEDLYEIYDGAETVDDGNMPSWVDYETCQGMCSACQTCYDACMEAGGSMCSVACASSTDPDNMCQAAGIPEVVGYIVDYGCDSYCSATAQTAFAEHLASVNAWWCDYIYGISM